MQPGDQVALFSHNGFRRFLIITDVGLSSGLGNGLACFKTSEGSLFYIKPELNTGRLYNVGNSAFWCVKPNKMEWLIANSDEDAQPN